MILDVRVTDKEITTVALSHFEDVPLVEFMYLVCTHMPGKSYRRRLRSLLLYLCYVFRAENAYRRSVSRVQLQNLLRPYRSENRLIGESETVAQPKNRPSR